MSEDPLNVALAPGELNPLRAVRDDGGAGVAHPLLPSTPHTSCAVSPSVGSEDGLLLPHDSTDEGGDVLNLAVYAADTSFFNSVPQSPAQQNPNTATAPAHHPLPSPPPLLLRQQPAASAVLPLFDRSFAPSAVEDAVGLCGGASLADSRHHRHSHAMTQTFCVSRASLHRLTDPSSPLSELVRGAALREDADAPFLNIPAELLQRAVPDVAAVLSGSATMRTSTVSKTSLSTASRSATHHHQHHRPAAAASYGGTRVEAPLTFATSLPRTAPSSLADVAAVAAASRAMAATMMADPDAPRPHPPTASPTPPPMLLLLHFSAPPPPTLSTSRGTTTAAAEKEGPLTTKRGREHTLAAPAVRPPLSQQSPLVPPESSSSRTTSTSSLAEPPSSSLSAFNTSFAVPPQVAHITTVPAVMSPVSLHAGSLTRSFSNAMALGGGGDGAPQPSPRHPGAAPATASTPTKQTPTAAARGRAMGASTSSSFPLSRPPMQLGVRAANTSITSSTGSRPSTSTPSFILPHSPLSPDAAWATGRGFGAFVAGSPPQLNHSPPTLVHGQDPMERRLSTSGRLSHSRPAQPSLIASSSARLERVHPVPSIASVLSSGNCTDAPFHFDDLLDNNTVSSYDDDRARDYAAETTTDMIDDEDDRYTDEVLEEALSDRDALERRRSGSSGHGRRLRHPASAQGSGRAWRRQQQRPTQLIPASSFASAVPPPYPSSSSAPLRVPSSGTRDSVRGTEDGDSVSTGGHTDDFAAHGLRSVEMPSFPFEGGEQSSIGINAAAAAASLVAAWRAGPFTSPRSSMVSQPVTVDSASTSTSSHVFPAGTAMGLSTPSASVVGGAESTGLPFRTAHNNSNIIAPTRGAVVSGWLKDRAVMPSAAAASAAAAAAPLPRAPSSTTVTAGTSPAWSAARQCTPANDYLPRSSSRRRPVPHVCGGPERDLLEGSLSALDMPEVVAVVTPHSATEPTSSVLTAVTTPDTVLSHAGGVSAGGEEGGSQEPQSRSDHPSIFAESPIGQQEVEVMMLEDGRHGANDAAAASAAAHAAAATVNPSPLSLSQFRSGRPLHTGPWSSSAVLRPPPLTLTRRSRQGSSVASATVAAVGPEGDAALREAATALPAATAVATADAANGSAPDNVESTVHIASRNATAVVSSDVPQVEAGKRAEKVAAMPEARDVSPSEEPLQQPQQQEHLTDAVEGHVVSVRKGHKQVAAPSSQQQPPAAALPHIARNDSSTSSSNSSSTATPVHAGMSPLSKNRVVAGADVRAGPMDTVAQPLPPPPPRWHTRLLWILLPYGVFAVLLAVATFVSTHVVAQRIVSHAWNEQHTYMRSELVAFMEEVTLLPVMSSEILTAKMTKNGESPTAPHTPRPPSRNLSRALCAAIKFTDLSKYMATFSYAALSSTKEHGDLIFLPARVCSTSTYTAGRAAVLRHLRRDSAREWGTSMYLEHVASSPQPQPPLQQPMKNRSTRSFVKRFSEEEEDPEVKTAFAFCDAGHSTQYYAVGSRDSARASNRHAAATATPIYAINASTLDVREPLRHLTRIPPCFDGNMAARISHILPTVHAWKAAVARGDGSQARVSRWWISAEPFERPSITYVHPFYEYGRREPSYLSCRMDAEALLRGYVAYQLRRPHAVADTRVMVVVPPPPRERPATTQGDRVNIVARSWALNMAEMQRRAAATLSTTTPPRPGTPAPTTVTTATSSSSPTEAPAFQAVDESEACSGYSPSVTRGCQPSANVSYVCPLAAEEECQLGAEAEQSDTAGKGDDGTSWIPWFYTADPPAVVRLDDVGDAFMQAALRTVDLPSYAAQMHEHLDAWITAERTAVGDERETMRDGDAPRLGDGRRTVMHTLFREFYFEGQRAAVSVSAVHLRSNFSAVVVLATPLAPRTSRVGGEALLRYVAAAAVAVVAAASSALVYLVLTCYLQLPLIAIQHQLELVVVLRPRKTAAASAAAAPTPAAEEAESGPALVRGAERATHSLDVADGAPCTSTQHRSGEGVGGGAPSRTEATVHRDHASSDAPRLLNPTAVKAGSATTTTTTAAPPPGFLQRMRLRLRRSARRLVFYLMQLRLSEVAELQQVCGELRQHVRELQRYMLDSYPVPEENTAGGTAATATAAGDVDSMSAPPHPLLVGPRGPLAWSSLEDSFASSSSETERRSSITIAATATSAAAGGVLDALAAPTPQRTMRGAQVVKRESRGEEEGDEDSNVEVGSLDSVPAQVTTAAGGGLGGGPCHSVDASQSGFNGLTHSHSLFCQPDSLASGLLSFMHGSTAAESSLLQQQMISQVLQRLEGSGALPWSGVGARGAEALDAGSGSERGEKAVPGAADSLSLSQQQQPSPPPHSLLQPAPTTIPRSSSPFLRTQEVPRGRVKDGDSDEDTSSSRRRSPVLSLPRILRTPTTAAAGGTTASSPAQQQQEYATGATKSIPPLWSSEMSADEFDILALTNGYTGGLIPSGCDPDTSTPSCISKCFCTVLAIHIHLHDASAVLPHFHEIMRTVEACVHRYGGIFDILVPEMIYVSFGSRVRMKDHAVLATRCGIEIFSRLSTAALRYMTFVIDTGVYAVGLMGVPEHKGFVMWGRPTGELIFEQQYQCGFRFLVTDAAVPLLRQHFRLLPIDVVTIEEELGRPNLVLYVLLVGSVRDSWWEDFNELAHAAFLHLIRGNFEAARPLYDRLLHTPSVTFTIVFQYLLVHERVLMENKACLSPTELARQLDELTVTCVNELCRERDPVVMPFGSAMPWIGRHVDLTGRFSDEERDDDEGMAKAADKRAASVAAHTAASKHQQHGQNQHPKHQQQLKQQQQRQSRSQEELSPLSPRPPPGPFAAAATCAKQRALLSAAAQCSATVAAVAAASSVSVVSASTVASLSERTHATTKAGSSVSTATLAGSSVAEGSHRTHTTCVHDGQRRGPGPCDPDASSSSCDSAPLGTAMTAAAATTTAGPVSGMPAEVDRESTDATEETDVAGEEDVVITAPHTHFRSIALPITDVFGQTWQLANTPIGGAEAQLRLDSALAFAGILASGAVAEVWVYAVNVAPETWAGKASALMSSPIASAAPLSGQDAAVSAIRTTAEEAAVAVSEGGTSAATRLACPSAVAATVPHTGAPAAVSSQPWHLHVVPPMVRGAVGHVATRLSHILRRHSSAAALIVAGEEHHARSETSTAAMVVAVAAAATPTTTVRHDSDMAGGALQSPRSPSTSQLPTDVLPFASPSSSSSHPLLSSPDDTPSETAVCVDVEAMKAVARRYCHGAMIQVLSLALTPTHVYVITEWMAGRTLRETVNRFGSRLALASTRKCCVSVLRALDYLHKRGVVHGRIHPDNILFGVEGNCKMTGMLYLYQWAEADPALHARLTHAPAAYCSPEVNLYHAPPSPAADIYAFGLLLLQMLTGERPWTWAGTPGVAETSTSELLAMLQDDHVFFEAVKAGVLQLRQYGRERNGYIISVEAQEAPPQGAKLLPDTHTDDDEEQEEELPSNRMGRPGRASHARRRAAAAAGRDASTSTARWERAEREEQEADPAMLRVLEGCLAYAPAQRRSAAELLEILSEM